MKVNISPEQRLWLGREVAVGEFGSVVQAVRHFIDACMAEESGDLASARPFVEQALRPVRGGELICRVEDRRRSGVRLGWLPSGTGSAADFCFGGRCRWLGRSGRSGYGSRPR